MNAIFTMKSNGLAEKTAYSLGEYVRDSYLHMHNRGPSPQFEAYRRRIEVVAAASGLSESVPSDGGFLTGADLMGDIIARVWRPGSIASRCTRIPTTQLSIDVSMLDEKSRIDGSRAGGLLGYWSGEASTIGATHPTFRSVGLTMKKLTALLETTNETLDDIASFNALLDVFVASEFAYLLEDSIIRGSGTDRPLGLLNSPCRIIQAKESGQADDTINWLNLANMMQRMWTGGLSSAVWIVNQDALPQLRAITRGTATGPAAYAPSTAEGEPDRLLGRPVIVSESASALGDEGDVILADLSQ